MVWVPEMEMDWQTLDFCQQEELNEVVTFSDALRVRSSTSSSSSICAEFLKYEFLTSGSYASSMHCVISSNLLLEFHSFANSLGQLGRPWSPLAALGLR